MNFNLHNFKGGYNFLGLAEEDTLYKDAKAVILPVPYDSTTSYRAGTREGPAAIISASRQVELYDIELQCEPITMGIHTLPEFQPDMRGPEFTVNNLQKAVKQIFSDNKIPVILGGEHSITTAPVKAAKEIYKDSLSVLQLDAHADLRNTYENTPFNHASVMRRVIDIAPIVQVGIRNISYEEVEFIKEINHNKIYWAHDICTNTNDKWVEQVISDLSENVYLTIDLDAFDSSVMPAVGTPEPGGLQWYETLKLLNKLIEKRNVVGFDVVELCPIPGNIAPDFLAAKLIFKILGKIFYKNKFI